MWFFFSRLFVFKQHRTSARYTFQASLGYTVSTSPPRKKNPKSHRNTEFLVVEFLFYKASKYRMAPPVGEL